MKTICFSLPEIAQGACVNPRTAARRALRAGLECDILAIAGADKPPLQLFSEARLPEVLRAIRPTPEFIA